MIRKGKQGEQVRKREKGVELNKIAVLALVLRADDRTQEQIAEACQGYPDGKGISKTVLSEYANEKRPLGETHLRVIASVIGVRPELLAKNLSKAQIVEAVEDKVAQVSESAVSPAIYLLPPIPVDSQITEIDSIAKHPSFHPVDAYASIAAGGLDDTATVKEGVVWVPKKFAGCYGLRVTGESMVNAGINPGDLLFVRQVTRVKEERICVALIESGATVKRFRIVDGDPVLCAEGEGHPNIPASEGFKVQGLVLAIYKPK